MSARLKITNERELKQARQRLIQMRNFLSAQSTFDLIQGGISPEIIEAQQKSATITLKDIENSIEEYISYRNRDYSDFKNIDPSDLPKLPIIARLMRGMTQEDFAKSLGIKQQQLQKYESEEYSSMKLGSFIALLDTLGVKIEKASIYKDKINPSALNIEVKPKLAKFAIKSGWVGSATANEEGFSAAEKYIKSIYLSFLRDVDRRSHFRGHFRKGNTSFTAEHLVWLARVADIAKESRRQNNNLFNSLDTSYLKDLLSLSRLPDGPLRSIEFLRGIGVTAIVEPNLPDTSIDGAAFSLDGTPVIGLTIRHDRIDNFWFTLLHELGHVHLHQSSGLEAGFMDDFDNMPDSDLEQEADWFALEAVIPSEKWRLSPARLATKVEPVMRLANILDVNEAIIFGRIRKERGFNLFSDQVGQGQVRKLFKTDER